MRGDSLLHMMSMKVMLALLVACNWFYCSSYAQKACIIVPVANVLVSPEKLEIVKAPVTQAKNVASLITHALFGEQIDIKYEHGDWLYVSLGEQKKYEQNSLTSLQGWVCKNQAVKVAEHATVNLVVNKHNAFLYGDDGTKLSLSLGTYLQGSKSQAGRWQVVLPHGQTGWIAMSDVYNLDQPWDKGQSGLQEMRKRLMLCAHSMKEQPFCFFGRSSFNEHATEQLTGLGCDGLVSLLYRTIGMNLPRFAIDQLRGGISCHGKDLEPGDLIFFIHDQRPNHAMVYLGNGMLLEATYQSKPPWYPARVIACSERLRMPLSMISNNHPFGSYKICFCSYLSSWQKIREFSIK